MIALTPRRGKVRVEGPTIRDEVLTAVVRIRARTGVETVLRREVVEVLSGDVDFREQSVLQGSAADERS